MANMLLASNRYRSLYYHCTSASTDTVLYMYGIPSLPMVLDTGTFLYCTVLYGTVHTVQYGTECGLRYGSL